MRFLISTLWKCFLECSCTIQIVSILATAVTRNYQVSTNVFAVAKLSKRLDAVQRAKLRGTQESISDRPVDPNFAGKRQAMFSKNFEKK